jgi:L-fuconolactonase
MQTPSAPARHLPIRKDWLAATQEPALEPERPIIDPHHHLWDRPGNRYLLHDLVEDLNSGTTSAPRSFSNAARCTAPKGRPNCAPWAKHSSSPASRR